MNQLQLRGCLPSVTLLLLMVLCCCIRKHAEVHRSFYYWKSSFNLSAAEAERLRALEINRLYLRFFDVTMGEEGKAVPVAKLVVNSPLPDSMEIVPVVFITNRVMEKTNIADIDSLAGKISKLLLTISANYNIIYREVQIDCDWTLGTKSKYFALLSTIKKLQQKTLSATIRLHQVKYYRKTGIPPVDRGMLMFYNMGNLKDVKSNSIFNTADAERYAKSINQYPLALDVALPLFGWIKHYRGNKMEGLINHISPAELQSDTALLKMAEGKYTPKRSMFYHGEYLRKGDLLAVEEVDATASAEAAALLKKNFRAVDFYAALYHCDSLTLSQYENPALEKIFNTLR